MGEIALELPKAVPRKEPTPDQIRVETVQTLQRREQFSADELRQIETYRRRIDPQSSASLLCYGESVQRKFQTFTDGALKSVMGRDIGEIGGLLSKMSATVKDFDTDTRLGILGVFRSAKKTESLQAKYAEANKTLTRTQQELDGWRMKLLVDLKALDELFQQVSEYYRTLMMYITAGRQRLEELRASSLQALHLQAEIMRTPDTILTYGDLEDKCKTFGERLKDLELTKTICVQTAVQIQLVQNSDRQLVASIQSSIHNAVALWQQNIATALTMQRNQSALKAQNAQLLTSLDDAITLQMTASRQRAETASITVDAIN